MTWSEFRAAVILQLPVEGERGGIEDYREQQMRNAVVDLQQHAPFYQQNQESTFLPITDLVVDGQAMEGVTPDGSFPREAYIVNAEDNCIRRPLNDYPWSQRHDLICGCAAGPCDTGFITFSPNADQFWVNPLLVTGEQLLLVWDGIQRDFLDATVVPFNDQQFIAAVAVYIKAWIAMYVDKQPALYESFMGTRQSTPGSYSYLQRQIYLASRNRTQLSDRSKSNSNISSSCCAPCPTPYQTPV